LLCRESDRLMPVRKVKGGYRWGGHGKVYPTREQAEAQGAAAYARGYRERRAQPVRRASRRFRAGRRPGR
jgi:hypothetical protein